MLAARNDYANESVNTRDKASSFAAVPPSLVRHAVEIPEKGAKGAIVLGTYRGIDFILSRIEFFVFAAPGVDLRLKLRILRQRRWQPAQRLLRVVPARLVDEAPDGSDPRFEIRRGRLEGADGAGDKNLGPAAVA